MRLPLRRSLVELKGRRVVITGAGGGIGTATMSALTAAGANVFGIDLNGSDDVIEGDICDREAISEAVQKCADRLGGLDILINNAGIGRAQDSGDFPDAEARAVLDVNFFGSWNATAAALPYLLQSSGHVVNIASGLAFVDLPFAAAYSASKRSLAAYSEALRLEYRGRLTVTTVYPGFIRTSIHDAAAISGVSLDGLVRADTVEGAAAAILRACIKKPRSASTSRSSSMEMWAARRFPRTTGSVIATRVTRWASTRAAPGFLRFPQPEAWLPIPDPGPAAGSAEEPVEVSTS